MKAKIKFSFEKFDFKHNKFSSLIEPHSHSLRQYLKGGLKRERHSLIERHSMLIVKLEKRSPKERHLNEKLKIERQLSWKIF